MATFRSCQLIVNRKLPDVRYFRDADFFSVAEVLLLYFPSGRYFYSIFRRGGTSTLFSVGEVLLLYF